MTGKKEVDPQIPPIRTSMAVLPPYPGTNASQDSRGLGAAGVTEGLDCGVQGSNSPRHGRAPVTLTVKLVCL